MEVTGKARKIGGSLGFIIPKEVVDSQGIKENDTLRAEIEKVVDLSDLFGKYKTGGGQKAKDELRRELWGIK